MEYLAHTEGSDPKDITGTILDNVADFSVRAHQITSGTLVRLIDVGRLLPVRMADDDNRDDYLGNVTNAEGILADYVQITGDLFNHGLAWEEEQYGPIVANATELLAETERLAFFVLNVANSLDPDGEYERALADNRGEVELYIYGDPSVLASTGNLNAPPYASIDDDDNASVTRGTWKSVGLSYDIPLVTAYLFKASRSAIANDLLSGDASHSLEFNSEFAMRGVSFLHDLQGGIPGEGAELLIEFTHTNVSSAYVSINNRSGQRKRERLNY